MLSHAEMPSAVALITVDKNAENCIVVAPGANATFFPEDLTKAKTIIEEASIILMQLEIPLATVEYIAGIAAAKGIRVILNPAPAFPLSDELLNNISIITPNENEAEMLTGIIVTDIDSAKEAAIYLHKKGVESVIITLGAKGALVFDKNLFTHVPSIIVDATDSTAAGDIFNGALVVALMEEKTITEATTFACKAAALSVTRLGAQASAPYREEVNVFTTI